MDSEEPAGIRAGGETSEQRIRGAELYTAFSLHVFLPSFFLDFFTCTLRSFLPIHFPFLSPCISLFFQFFPLSYFLPHSLVTSFPSLLHPSFPNVYFFLSFLSFSSNFLPPFLHFLPCILSFLPPSCISLFFLPVSLSPFSSFLMCFPTPCSLSPFPSPSPSSFPYVCFYLPSVLPCSLPSFLSVLPLLFLSLLMQLTREWYCGHVVIFSLMSELENESCLFSLTFPILSVGVIFTSGSLTEEERTRLWWGDRLNSLSLSLNHIFSFSDNSTSELLYFSKHYISIFL